MEPKLDEVSKGNKPLMGLLPVPIEATAKPNTIEPLKEPNNKSPTASQSVSKPLMNQCPEKIQQSAKDSSEVTEATSMPKASSGHIKPLMELNIQPPAELQSISRPLLGLFPHPVGAATMPIPLMRLLPDSVQAAAMTIPLMEFFMKSIQDTAMQKSSSGRKPSSGPIKPLMEQIVEPPAALQSQLWSNLGTTKSSKETTEKSEAVGVFQPNLKPALGDLAQTAGSAPDSSSLKPAEKPYRTKRSRSASPFEYFTDGSQHWMRVSERWLSYTPVGSPLRGTPFICFKTPLKFNFDNKLPLEDRFGVDTLVSIVKNLGMVIDLTATDRYVDVNDYRKRGIKYKKVMCQGAVVPHLTSVKAFFNAVDEYVMSPQAAGKMIGVNCTHGLNRTGYLVCRYMIQRLGFPPDTAISDFEDARGHAIERKEYVDDLKKELPNMPFYVGKKGLSMFLKLNFGPKSSSTGIPTLNARRDAPSEMTSVQQEPFSMNRANEINREPIFPPQRENNQQWQSQPPTQLPAGDLRERLSSNSGQISSHFYNKDGHKEVPQMSSSEKPFQNTFYPKGDTGNQYRPMSPEHNQPTTSQMRGNMEAQPRPQKVFTPRRLPDQRAEPVQKLHEDDHLQKRFYESNLAMGDMGYVGNMQDNYDIGSHERLSLDQGRHRFLGQSGSMQRDEDLSHFSIDEGRSRMWDQLRQMQRDEEHFSMDQDRPWMMGQSGPEQRDDYSHFSIDQDRPRMLGQIEPMQRNNVPHFSMNQDRPRMLGQSGPMQRDEDLQKTASSGPFPTMMKKEGSFHMGYDGPSDMFGKNAVVPFASTSSLAVMPGGLNRNAHIDFGGLDSGRNSRGVPWEEDSRAKNYREEGFEIPGMQNRNVVPFNKLMDSTTMDNRPQSPISNRNVYERLGDHLSRERSSAEDQFSRNFRSRSRDLRQSRSRSTSRRRSRSSDRSEKRIRMGNQHDKDLLFTRRGESGGGRSRSRDRFETMNQGNKYGKYFNTSMERESLRGIEEPGKDYPNPKGYGQSKEYEDEVIKQKLEHISDMTAKIGKAVNVMRTFNFPKSFYDNPDNSEFIHSAKKFQTLSNEIQNSWDSFNNAFEEHPSHSIVSKKTVKLDPSQYRKLQPPPEFMGLAAPDAADHIEQVEIRRGNNDSQSFEYFSLRAKYGAASRH